MNARSTSRKLRVVRVYLKLDVGGIETRLVDLLPRLDRELFDVQLICIRRPGILAPELERRGIPVRYCRCERRLPLFLTMPRLARAFRELSPDIVHAHAEEPAQFATAAGIRAGVPILVANYHNVSLFGSRRQVRRERKQAPHRDATVHVSDSVRVAYRERIGATQRLETVIYNGVDVAAFSRAPAPDRLRELAGELGIERNAPVLLNVARLQRHKAHEDLLRAFAKIREGHPRSVLLLAGEGRRRSDIERRVRELGLGDSVKLLGLRSDTRELYHLADLHLLSSIKEGFSNVVLEAMAAGVPQVLTDVGGNGEAVGQSDAAVLVPPRRPLMFAAAVDELLGATARVEAMGRAASLRALRFSVGEQVRRTEELYLDLARRKGLI